jgi:hypothetical protein
MKRSILHIRFCVADLIGEQKATCYTPLVKRCAVSFTDTVGMSHTVTLEARSLFEAAAAGLEIFRQAEWSGARRPLAAGYQNRGWQETGGDTGGLAQVGGPTS